MTRTYEQWVKWAEEEGFLDDWVWYEASPEFVKDLLNDWKEEREQANKTADNLIVDTCAVTDAEQPFETGVSHPAYNDREWVIVEMYDTEEQARQGHDKWVATMTAESLPETLIDAGTSVVNQLRDASNPGGDSWREFKKGD